MMVSLSMKVRYCVGRVIYNPSIVMLQDHHGSTPSFPLATTMTTLALGGALHISMLLEEVVGGSRGKMQRDSVVGGGMEGSS